METTAWNDIVTYTTTASSAPPNVWLYGEYKFVEVPAISTWYEYETPTEPKEEKTFSWKTLLGME